MGNQMAKIKFGRMESTKKGITFGTCRDYDFFIGKDGSLYQAGQGNHAWLMADENGNPKGSLCAFNLTDPIKKIIRHPERIKFK